MIINKPELLEINDPLIGLKGYLAIDSLVNNRCCGGLRASPDVSADEMRKLAHLMTLKYGFLGLPHGGAKAGIVFDERTGASKAELLGAFMRQVRRQLGDYVYTPHPDVGTDNKEICAMLVSAGINIPKRAVVSEKSGWYTSLTVIASIKAASLSSGLNLKQSSAAVAGFGKVGSAVAEGLDKMGVKVLAISTSEGALYRKEGLDIPRLIALSREFKSNLVHHYKEAQKLDKDKLVELDVDILSPCAVGNCIHSKNAARVKSRMIVAGANNPISDEAYDMLYQQGIAVMPDFISNAGGVLGGTMQFAGIEEKEIIDFIDNDFLEQARIFIAEAAEKGLGLYALAEAAAYGRFLRLKTACEKRSISNRIFSWALEFYRNGIMPKSAVSLLSKRYFRRRIQGRL